MTCINSEPGEFALEQEVEHHPNAGTKQHVTKRRIYRYPFRIFQLENCYVPADHSRKCNACVDAIGPD